MSNIIIITQEASIEEKKQLREFLNKNNYDYSAYLGDNGPELFEVSPYRTLDYDLIKLISYLDNEEWFFSQRLDNEFIN